MKHVATPSIPKQARAIATRVNLLDATVAGLCELGYAGTTTTMVASRAGVSQGALYKHFGSKHQLIAATTEHLFSGLVEDFRAAFAAGAGDEDHLSRALRELWLVFLKPELYAVLELYIAARTDDALRQALVPVLLRHRANLQNEARTLFPGAAEANPRFEMAVDSILSAMQGAAMSAAVLRDLSDGRDFGQFLEHVCRRELEPPYGVS
jgi:AcrR family transcriptional regulator